MATLNEAMENILYTAFWIGFVVFVITLVVNKFDGNYITWIGLFLMLPYCVFMALKFHKYIERKSQGGIVVRSVRDRRISNKKVKNNRRNNQ